MIAGNVNFVGLPDKEDWETVQDLLYSEDNCKITIEQKQQLRNLFRRYYGKQISKKAVRFLF